MELLAQFIRTFLCGGVLCLIGQILIDKTSLTPAKILTMYVIAGVVLGAIGVYEPIAQWGGGREMTGRAIWNTYWCGSISSARDWSAPKRRQTRPD